MLEQRGANNIQQVPIQNDKPADKPAQQANQPTHKPAEQKPAEQKPAEQKPVDTSKNTQQPVQNTTQPSV